MTNRPRRHLAGAADESPRPARQAGPAGPALRFTPYAWAKLLLLRDLGPTEVGGFGVTAKVDPLLVEDVRLVRQTCSAVTVAFDDEAVADFFDERVDAGLRPERFGRVWVHTHPGDCPRPSGTDEETFARAFAGLDWAVMAILARGGESYARLKFGCGPGAELVIPVRVEYATAFPAADHAAWRAEYEACVRQGAWDLPLPGALGPAPAGPRLRAATAPRDDRSEPTRDAADLALDLWEEQRGWGGLDAWDAERFAADAVG